MAGTLGGGGGGGGWMDGRTGVCVCVGGGALTIYFVAISGPDIVSACMLQRYSTVEVAALVFTRCCGRRQSVLSNVFGRAR